MSPSRVFQYGVVAFLGGVGLWYIVPFKVLALFFVFAGILFYFFSIKPLHAFVLTACVLLGFVHAHRAVHTSDFVSFGPDRVYVQGAIVTDPEERGKKTVFSFQPDADVAYFPSIASIGKTTALIDML